MKFIKTVAVLLAVSVSLMVPSFAWDSDSFVGQDFYFYEPVINYAAQSPSLMAAGDASSHSSVSGQDFLNLFSYNGGYPYINARYWVHRDSYSIAGVTIPAYNGPSSNDAPYVPLNRLFLGEELYFTGNIPYELDSDYDFIGYVGPCLGSDDSSLPMSGSCVLSLSFDISSFGEFYVFELDGLIRSYTYLYSHSLNHSFSDQSRPLSLYVNGSLVKTFYPGADTYIDFANYTYNSSVPITSIVFQFSAPGSTYERGDAPSYGSIISCNYVLRPGAVPPSFSILTGEDVLTGQAGSTQDDVNEIEGIESQWGNSMTENFNALSLDTFTYPDGLTAGFSLISGVFQDLWNAMGSYSILYVLPLTLAVVLLLIGRISKFAGQGRSSPSKEE